MKPLSTLIDGKKTASLFGRQRLFVFFVLVSLLFWGITKLSKPYQVSLPFEVRFVGVPTTLVIEAQNPTVAINITASGFDILRYQWFKNSIELRADGAQQKGSFLEISLAAQQFFLQDQLFENTTLNGFKAPVLQLPYSVLSKKRVPIFVQATLDFKPGYLLEDGLMSQPDSVEVVGTKEQLDTLSFVRTQPFEKSNLSDSFELEVQLKDYEALHLEANRVKVVGRVFSYTEKKIQLPISILNLPPSTQMKLFPAEATLTLLARVDQLQRISSNEFVLSVDFNDWKDNELLALPLKLTQAPSGIKKMEWQPKKVEFLIRR